MSANIHHMKLATMPITVIDHAACGQAARAGRTAKRVSLRTVAQRMGVSAAYLSDLERGRRNWSEDVLKRFNAALKK